MQLPTCNAYIPRQAYMLTTFGERVGLWVARLTSACGKLRFETLQVTSPNATHACKIWPQPDSPSTSTSNCSCPIKGDTGTAKRVWAAGMTSGGYIVGSSGYQLSPFRAEDRLKSEEDMQRIAEDYSKNYCVSTYHWHVHVIWYTYLFPNSTIYTLCTTDSAK